MTKYPVKPRIPLVERTDFTPAQAALASGRDQYNLTRMLVRHPDFYGTFVPFLTKLMGNSLLPQRDREILILRTLGLCGESYEEQHHMIIAQAVGLSASAAAAARDGHTDVLDERDRVLVWSAEELVNERCISDHLWDALAQRFSAEQLIEVVFLVGSFTMVSMATNSLGIPIDSVR